MPRYSYTARTANGESIASVADAPSLPALAAALSAEGASIQSARAFHKEIPCIRGIPYFEVLGIYRQIASSIEAGMPLKETLAMLSRESRNPKLRSLLHFLEREIGEGSQLSEAMKLFPNIFPPVHLAVIRAGEESERLGPAIEELAEQAETFSNMNRRFASALVYPAVIGTFALALLNFSFAFVVPKFMGLFSDLGIRELPTITRFAFFVARWIVPATALIILAVLALVFVIALQRKAASGRLLLDSWKLRLPLVGQIVEKSALARFAGTLGLLLDAGIELPRALDMAAEGTGNGTVERILRNVSIDVERGRSLSESIDSHQAMPPTMAWRIGVGEQSGALSESLIKISKLYARQVDSLVTSLAGFMEPMLIIFVGSGVFMLVLGMFLPLVAVIQNLSGGGM
jgi:type IV pilus assembly protein PilC